MKVSFFFSISLVTLLFTSCKDFESNAKNSILSIDNQLIKTIYQPTDSLKLQIANPTKAVIDSVIYSINDQKIGSVVQNSVLVFTLTNQKLGYQHIKASVYTNGKSDTVEIRTEMASNTTPKLIKYTLINTFPHDINAYTQGLEFHKDTLIESTGLYGMSSLRKTNAKTGVVYSKIDLEKTFFGEGITIFKNKIFQLTWKEKQGFIYDVNTLKKTKTFGYHKNVEGWGLCNDGSSIYFSDGTEKIWKLNPETLKDIDYINVYTNNSKIKSVNELEYINGKIFANVYQKSAIAIIDPNTGAVEGIINLSELEKKVTKHPKLDVLNGIAYNPKTNTIFVTGKNWDKMFEIKLDN